MAYVWKTQIIPTPAEPGAHYFNPTWDVNGFIAMAIANTPTGYTAAGPNTFELEARGLDLFGFTSLSSTIDTFVNPAQTARYNVIVPNPDTPIAFYMEHNGDGTYALQRDRITESGGTLNHNIDTLVAASPGPSNQLNASYRTSGTGTGTYAVAIDSDAGATYAINARIYNPDHS